MIDLIQTEIFRKWRLSLRDKTIRALIASRLDRLAFGHTGDAKPVGEGVSELRIDHGPGYRIYYCKQGSLLILLLCGGSKRTQIKDIRMAQQLAKEWKGQNG